MFDRGPSTREQIGALRAEVERLRAFIEARAQAQEAMQGAIALESRTRLAEAIEQRIQLAAAEAIAFAENGLVQHEAALRAIGRRVSELSRDSPSLVLPRPDALAVPPAHTYLIGNLEGEHADCRRIELRDEREETYLADLANLPILPGGAATLVAGHIVERVPPLALAQDLLPHWRQRLARGGELVVVTLDGPAWFADLARRADDFEGFRARLLDRGGRPLRNLFDADGLRQMLVAAGFAEVEAATRHGETLRIVARAAAS